MLEGTGVYRIQKRSFGRLTPGKGVDPDLRASNILQGGFLS